MAAGLGDHDDHRRLDVGLGQGSSGIIHRRHTRDVGHVRAHLDDRHEHRIEQLGFRIGLEFVRHAAVPRGRGLQSMYQEYESQGGSSSFTPGQPSDKLLQISGTSVEVSLKIASGSNFDTALSQLQSDGMQVSSSSSTYALIEGMLPIAELPAAAQIAASVTPVSPPMLS